MSGPKPEDIRLTEEIVEVVVEQPGHPPRSFPSREEALAYARTLKESKDLTAKPTIRYRVEHSGGFNMFNSQAEAEAFIKTFGPKAKVYRPNTLPPEMGVDELAVIMGNAVKQMADGASDKAVRAYIMEQLGWPESREAIGSANTLLDELRNSDEYKKLAGTYKEQAINTGPSALTATAKGATAITAGGTQTTPANQQASTGSQVIDKAATSTPAGSVGEKISRLLGMSPFQQLTQSDMVAYEENLAALGRHMVERYGFNPLLIVADENGAPRATNHIEVLRAAFNGVSGDRDIGQYVDSDNPDELSEFANISLAKVNAFIDNAKNMALNMLLVAGNKPPVYGDVFEAETWGNIIRKGYASPDAADKLRDWNIKVYSDPRTFADPAYASAMESVKDRFYAMYDSQVQSGKLAASTTFGEFIGTPSVSREIEGYATAAFWRKRLNGSLGEGALISQIGANPYGESGWDKAAKASVKAFLERNSGNIDAFTGMVADHIAGGGKIDETTGGFPAIVDKDGKVIASFNVEDQLIRKEEYMASVEGNLKNPLLSPDARANLFLEWANYNIEEANAHDAEDTKMSANEIADIMMQGGDIARNFLFRLNQHREGGAEMLVPLVMGYGEPKTLVQATLNGSRVMGAQSLLTLGFARDLDPNLAQFIRRTAFNLDAANYTRRNKVSFSIDELTKIYNDSAAAGVSPGDALSIATKNRAAVIDASEDRDAFIDAADIILGTKAESRAQLAGIFDHARAIGADPADFIGQGTGAKVDVAALVRATSIISAARSTELPYFKSKDEENKYYKELINSTLTPEQLTNYIQQRSVAATVQRLQAGARITDTAGTLAGYLGGDFAKHFAQTAEGRLGVTQDPTALTKNLKQQGYSDAQIAEAMTNPTGEGIAEFLKRVKPPSLDERTLAGESQRQQQHWAGVDDFFTKLKSGSFLPKNWTVNRQIEQGMLQQMPEVFEGLKQTFKLNTGQSVISQAQQAGLINFNMPNYSRQFRVRTF